MMIPQVARVAKIMLDFAGLTGLEPVSNCPKRYLWTDSFAVCNFLGLHELTNDGRFLDLAKRLVEQVHHHLGRHRSDDPNGRNGWISGFGDEEGNIHPTIAGLRIGKEFNERQKSDPIDTELEWIQDGQYFHYLTKWMHALQRMSHYTGEHHYLQLAMEMAKGVFPKFSYATGGQGGVFRGKYRMYWKMSIDLSYPLVTSMGQHDALDGFLTYRELNEAASKVIPLGALPGTINLDPEIAILKEMASEGTWSTHDTLGLGGLLCDAFKVVQFSNENVAAENPFICKLDDKCVLSKELLYTGLIGLRYILSQKPMLFDRPAKYRLAFRELGLSIGYKATCALLKWLEEYPQPNPQWEEVIHLSEEISERYRQQFQSRC